MAKRIKDLAVATGTYTDNFGAEKRRYMNCGALMENDDGGQFVMLNRFIDYGALPSKGGESILISAFDIKPRDGTAAQTTQSNSGGNFGGDVDSVPFD